MKIAIIGCGYVGKALALYLSKKGHSITATTRSHEKAALLREEIDTVKILYGNDLQAFTDLLQNQDAAILCVAADRSDDYTHTYLETSKTLSLAATHLSQIIYTSSTSVYGDHNGHTVDESTPPLPSHITSQILVATENQLLTLPLNVCIFRLGEIYGPGRDIADRLRQLNGKSLPGTGDNTTNLIHIDDILSATDFALNHHLNGIYNLCNDIHIPRKQLYDSICTENHLQKITWDPSKQSIHSGNKIVSNAKIKSAGYTFAMRGA